jgi:Protein of unknown function (DUF3306)
VNRAWVQVMVDAKQVPPAEGLSLSRWSRLKRNGGEVVAARSSAAPDIVNDAVVASRSAEAETVAELKLPQLSSISLVEDFTPFMQAKVPQALRQQALKALFKEPHFNVMDGLDTYIDDYTVFESITPEVMATLSSWKTIMNPTQQVVTPGGYAVDVESEEGKAVLAARAEADALAQGLSPFDDTPHPGAHLRQVCLALPQAERGPASLKPDQNSNEHVSAPSPLAGEGWGEGVGEQAEQRSAMATNQHPRHNKRVGDFTYIDASEVPPPGAEKAE